jgi:hypothetical protein
VKKNHHKGTTLDQAYAALFAQTGGVGVRRELLVVRAERGAGLSKLTNCQIAAQIYGLKNSMARAALRNDDGSVRRLWKKIEGYVVELRQRREAGLDPGTEIQDSVAGRKG